ncbi:MAG: CDP-alcohol phosphatidyltransferase family protein [Nitrospirota bacterium]|nr:MAG: CDP-alcohol phosphatidyltransferase family protein [Nitrospirota bacterium]
MPIVPLNIPNTLTVLRILLVPVFVGFLIYKQDQYALITLLIAALTDGLDGAIARLANQRTLIGSYLDPLADKIMLMSAFVTLSVLHLIPVWTVILVVSRDVILLTGTLLARLTESNVDLAPTILGKGATLVQFLYVTGVVAVQSGLIEKSLLPPLLVLMAVLTVFSGLHYVYRGIMNVNAGNV